MDDVQANVNDSLDQVKDIMLTMQVLYFVNFDYSRTCLPKKNTILYETTEHAFLFHRNV